MKELDINLLNLSFHNLLKKRFGINYSVHRKKAYEQLGRHYLVPKQLRIIVLKEMEEMKLIKMIDRDNFIVLNSKIDINKDTNSFFKKVKLF